MEERKEVDSLARTIRILLLVIVAATVVTYFVFAEQQRAEVLPTVANVDKIKQQRLLHTPGLLQAEELGLTRDIQKKWDIPHSEYAFILEQIWYSSNLIYFFYSLDFGDEPLTEERIPHLHFRVSPAGNEETDGLLQQGTFTKNWGFEQGIMYGNRYYHQVVAYPLQDEKLQPLQAVDRLRLTGIELTLGEDVYTLPEIELEVDYERDRERERTYVIDDTFFYGDYRMLPEKLTIGTAKNELYFRFETGGRDVELSELDARLLSDAGEMVTVDPGLVTRRDDGGYIVSFQPFQYWPDHIEFQLESIRMSGAEEFAYIVDAAQLREGKGMSGSEERRNERIAHLVNTDIMLDRWVWEDDGVHVRFRYQYGGTWDKPSERLAPGALLDRSWSEETGWNHRMLFDVSNEDGERAEVERREFDHDSFGFLLPWSFVEQSEQIKIHIGRLIHEMDDKRERKWMLDRPLPDERT